MSYTSDYRVDSTGLSRYASALITGNNKHKTRIMVTYRSNVGGNYVTVFSQYERYFQTRNDNRNPLVAYDADIEQCIKCIKHKEVRSF